MSHAEPPDWPEQMRTALAANAIPGTVLGQLATIRATGTGLAGRPASRTVNVRRFDADDPAKTLYFISDLRSAKAVDIMSAETPFAELCCYFADQRLQFRLSGCLSLLSGCPESDAVWATLSDRERMWFAWPTPAEPRGTDDSFDVSAPVEPPPHFCLCKMEPDHVDLLDLTTMPFQRYLFNRASSKTHPMKFSWSCQPVNP